jgi:hypothetical protein
LTKFKILLSAKFSNPKARKLVEIALLEDIDMIDDQLKKHKKADADWTTELENLEADQRKYELNEAALGFKDFGIEEGN